MRVVLLAAVLLTLAMVGMMGGHYFPDMASIFMGLTNAVGGAAVGVYVRSRKATRQ